MRQRTIPLLRIKRMLLLSVLALLFQAPGSVFAQGTAFQYQGKLTDAGNPANGNYDMQFKLFDSPVVGTGTQQGTTITSPSVAVSGGAFAVTLDFLANVFTGAPRYLEIGIRPAGSPNPYTLLSPRQPVTSTPYAIQTINAAQLGGLPSSRFISSDATGNVGIGTASPTTKLDVRGSLTLEAGASPGLFTGTGAVELNRYLALLNSPNLQSASGLKAGGILVSDDYFFANPAKNDLIVKGKVGIGATSPAARLQIANASDSQSGLLVVATEGDQGALYYSPNFGMVFDSFRPSDSRRLPVLLQPSGGNVGIGSFTPNHRLRVSGGPSWTSFNWSGSIELDNASAIGWRANSSNNRFGIGATNGGLIFFRTASDPGTTASPPIYDMVISDSGQVGIGTTAPTVGKLQVDGGGATGINGISSGAFSSAVLGISSNGTGVGVTGKNTVGNSGVYGESPFNGVYGHDTGATGYGVFGDGGNYGVYGSNDSKTGVRGDSNSGRGVWGNSISGQGVYGHSTSQSGVLGISDTFDGVFGESNSSSAAGVSGHNTAGGPAGVFIGNVNVTGNLSKGGGSFKIDNPLDPENKYLSHSFVESPDMMNVYNGNIITDSNGIATVTLPDYFEALNRDFRYQLTVIGQFAQAIVGSEIKNNQFTIKTDKLNVKVSWQVTGIRHDPYANANRIQVVEDKGAQRGKYLHPDLYYTASPHKSAADPQ